MRDRKSGRGYTLSYVELKVKFIAKSLTLFDKEQITSGSLVGTDGLTLLKVIDFPEITELKSFVFRFGLD